MQIKNLFWVLVVTIAALTKQADAMQFLGAKENYEHQSALTSISAKELYRMGADFCEHEQMTRLPLLYPGYELVLGITGGDKQEKLFHTWRLEEGEPAVPCNKNYQVQYYYISEKFLTHAFEVSSLREDILKERQSSYWHNIFKDQISQVGFEFIELFSLEINGLNFSYKLDNLNLSKLISNISLDLFVMLNIEPMLEKLNLQIQVNHSIKSNFPEIKITGDTYNDSVTPGISLRSCASCLADTLFIVAANISDQLEFSPMQSSQIFNCFKSININYFNNSKNLTTDLVQEIINYYLERLKILSPAEYENYKHTQVKALTFN